jgi:hypothetical protein
MCGKDLGEKWRYSVTDQTDCLSGGRGEQKIVWEGLKAGTFTKREGAVFVWM